MWNMYKRNIFRCISYTVNYEECLSIITHAQLVRTYKCTCKLYLILLIFCINKIFTDESIGVDYNSNIAELWKFLRCSRKFSPSYILYSLNRAVTYWNQKNRSNNKQLINFIEIGRFDREDYSTVIDRSVHCLNSTIQVYCVLHFLRILLITIRLIHINLIFTSAIVATLKNTVNHFYY